MKFFFFLSLLWTGLCLIWHKTDIRTEVVSDKKVDMQRVKIADKLLPNPIICYIIDILFLIVMSI